MNSKPTSSVFAGCLRRSLMLAALGASLAFAGGVAAADEYPSRPIKLIVPFAPGGGNDAIARLLGRQLTDSLGQPVVVENRAGAGGRIGVEGGIRAVPDGYTITLISNSYAANPSLYPIKFDPLKDITPIGMIARAPLLVTVKADLPVSNLQELVALAKTRPLTFASSGQGGISHLSNELFDHRVGIQMTHVPYQGTAGALNDMAGGVTDVFFSTTGPAQPLIKAQRLKVLAVTTPKRSGALPDVPTVMEAGVPGYEVTVWYGIVAPKGLPVAVQERLNKAMNTALASKEITDQLKVGGEEAAPGTPADFMNQITKEVALWHKVVEDSNIKID